MDLNVETHDGGVIWLLKAVSEAGREWIAEHIPGDAPMWAGAIAVEGNYIDDIVLGAIGDGMEVNW